MSEPARRWPPQSGPMGRGPVSIVKRDGHIEPFDRAKMIESMRNAGANPGEANLVTDRVSFRMAPRATIPSTEVSTMVARSLSHVNPTASRNYTDIRDQRYAYNERVNRLSATISIISQQVNGATTRVDSLNGQIQSLPARIARIRQGNYRLLPNLETDQAALSQDWNVISPELRATANLRSETARSQIQTLQNALSYKVGSGDYNINNLQEIESGIPEIRSTLSNMESSITTALSPFEKKFESMNQDLARVEGTISLLDGASFSWEEGETPVLAVRAKDMNSDFEGIMTLTNLKFVFEHEKEVVLKKTLFVVTEKKIVREVKVQKPIGMVTNLIRGKVSFFKGAGLFVKFASESGIPEMKFDTTNEDAEWVTKSYNQIISGQVDQELAASTPKAEEKEEKEKVKLVTCQVCGAPYTEKIYRGQTSINCKYCGALISIQK